jgi:hypothetical protein
MDAHPHREVKLKHSFRHSPPTPPHPPRTLLCAEVLTWSPQMATLPVTMHVNLASLSSDTARDLSVVSNSGCVSSVS